MSSETGPAARHVLVVQHVAAEPCGRLGDALAAHGVEPSVVRVDACDAIPTDLDRYDGLVVLGGPMGVRDAPRLPHLRREMLLIARALREDLPVLGVCLGAQLLAATLGADVRRGASPELGWHPVELADAAAEDPLFADVPSSIVPLSWHGDVFDAPPSTVLLASSGLAPVQAFRRGTRAWGLLFHLEVTESIVRAMVEASPEELRAAGTSGEAILGGMAAHLPAIGRIADRVFGRFARTVETRVRE